MVANITSKNSEHRIRERHEGKESVEGRIHKIVARQIIVGTR